MNWEAMITILCIMILLLGCFIIWEKCKLKERIEDLEDKEFEREKTERFILDTMNEHVKQTNRLLDYLMKVKDKTLIQWHEKVAQAARNMSKACGEITTQVAESIKVDIHYYGKIYYKYQTNVVKVFEIPLEDDPTVYTKRKLIEHILGQEDPKNFGASFEKRIIFAKEEKE